LASSEAVKANEGKKSH